jgi:hypothetical protein
METQQVVGTSVVVKNILGLLGALHAEQTQVQPRCYAIPLA